MGNENQQDRTAFFLNVNVKKDKNNNDFYGFRFGPLYITIRYNPDRKSWYALGKILPPRDNSNKEQQPFNPPRVQNDNAF